LLTLPEHEPAVFLSPEAVAVLGGTQDIAAFDVRGGDRVGGILGTLGRRVADLRAPSVVDLHEESDTTEEPRVVVWNVGVQGGRPDCVLNVVDVVQSQPEKLI